jgi:lipid-A-disaccharide synthase
MAEILHVLTAAEPSGEQLAAAVLTELERRHPDLTWTGYSGEAMRTRRSYRALGDASQLSGAGLVELIPRLPQLLAAKRKLEFAVDVAPVSVFVDAPDLHLPLARRAREAGRLSVMLVAPQFWAWRSGRKDFLARHVDLTLCLFRFEVEAIRSVGGAAHWVGHPCFERLPERTGRPDGPPRVAVLPGSRPNEVREHLEPFLAAAREALGPEGEIVVAWRLPDPPKKRPGVTFTMRPGAEVLAEADAALVAVGTATLEAAALGVPQVVGVRLHPLTAMITRRLVRTRYAALPNILLQERAVAEHWQDLGGMAADLRRLLADPEGSRQRAEEIATRLKPILGPPGFAERVVDHLDVLL